MRKRSEANSSFAPLEFKIKYVFKKTLTGFTFIELLITLAIIAICFLPLMRMFSVSLEQACVSNDLTTARYLAQEGMEKVKNSNFTEAQLKDLGDVWEPVLNKPPFITQNYPWN